ncbi:MAG: uracil-DNA glycosylase [Akkermansia sp.]|nr:uracil-DNA glycosylase [Akkermansia sp.]
MRTLKQLAVDALSNLPMQGQMTIAVDAEARAILREWMLAARRGIQTPVVMPPPAAVASPPPTEAPQTVEEKLEWLRSKAQNWKAAKALGTLRDTMVFATGTPHARLMLVGEAPGYEEELQQEPFVGPAGQKLTQILAAMGIRRSEVYISNICKFRPSMGPQQNTANRPPSEAEIAACLPIIQAEIRAISPACIVCLGGTAARGLLGHAASVASQRGKWFETQGIPTRVTYHPSYLLRNDTITARRAVWEDMLAVMQKLSMNISEKQRRYFQ